jgi:hypothetical protein
MAAGAAVVEADRFQCPFCNTEQRVSPGFFEVVFAQVLTHFSSCAPPSKFPDTEAIMKKAEEIANMISRDAR